MTLNKENSDVDLQNRDKKYSIADSDLMKLVANLSVQKRRRIKPKEPRENRPTKNTINRPFKTP